jgi:hypothetical protein
LVLIALGVSLLTASPGTAAEVVSRLEPAAHFKVSHPEVLAARINQLFDGTRVPHPAAALSAWKRATRGQGHLGKPLEALIALLNPEMAREWRSFDGTELTVWSALETGDAKVLEWSIVVPHDDGNVAAALMAGRLTGGGLDVEESHPDRAPVNRLGPLGAPLSTRIGRTLVIAASRRSLNRALDELALNTEFATTTADSEAPGIRFKIDGRLLACLPDPIKAGRVITAFGPETEGREIAGFATLEGDVARIRFHSSRPRVAPSPLLHSSPIEAEWLRWIPRPQALAAAVVRFHASPSTWDSFFTLIDRIEKTDPAKAGTMPFRTRFNILLGAAGVQPEIDLWPHLRGITATILGDRRRIGLASGVLLALHIDDETSARKVAEVLAPRVADLYFRKAGEFPKKSTVQPHGSDLECEIRTLGEVGKRSVLVARRGGTVLLGWGGGDALAERLRPGSDLDQHARDLLPAQSRAFDSSRLVLIWPGRIGPRIPGVAPASATGRVLEDAPPVVWSGGDSSVTPPIEDTIIWRDLHRLVKNFLETLPLEVSDRR